MAAFIIAVNSFLVLGYSLAHETSSSYVEPEKCYPIFCC